MGKRRELGSWCFWVKVGRFKLTGETCHITRPSLFQARRVVGVG